MMERKNPFNFIKTKYFFFKYYAQLLAFRSNFESFSPTNKHATFVGKNKYRKSLEQFFKIF